MHREGWSRLVAPLSEIDAPRVLGFWSWLITRPVEPVELTRFGDWFLLAGDGQVHRLDVLEGTLTPVCASVDEYQLCKNDMGDDCFSEGVVDALHERGLRPGAGEGFGYQAPPVLGGPFTLENIVLVELASWQIFMSMLHGAVRELPADTSVTGVEILPDGTLKLQTVKAADGFT